jgi:hypothetical protein
MVKIDELGTLKDTEPHPAITSAIDWFDDWQLSHPGALNRYIESFASCAIEGNRLAEICIATIRRLQNGQPVSDRYFLGLVWTIRSMEERSGIKQS